MVVRVHLLPRGWDAPRCNWNKAMYSLKKLKIGKVKTKNGYVQIEKIKTKKLEKLWSIQKVKIKKLKATNESLRAPGVIEFLEFLLRLNCPNHGIPR